jgi:magnesium-transporting ATPase (P-type)
LNRFYCDENYNILTFLAQHFAVFDTKLNFENETFATISQADFCEPVHRVGDLDEECRLLVGMAVCHELSKIDGEIMGDPLDVKIFESTGWTLEQDGEEENQVVSRRDSLSYCY